MESIEKPSLQEIQTVFKEVAKSVRDLYAYSGIVPVYDRNSSPFITALRTVDKMETLLKGDYKTLWIMEQEDAQRWERLCEGARTDVRNIIQSANPSRIVLNPEDDDTEVDEDYVDDREDEDEEQRQRRIEQVEVWNIQRDDDSYSSFITNMPSAILGNDDGTFTCDASMNNRVRSLSYESESESQFAPIAPSY